MMMEMTTELFYQDLLAFADPQGVSDPMNYTEVPDDWYIVMTDIKNSTHAIEAGNYREVNLVGAAATLLIPSSLLGRSGRIIYGLHSSKQALMTCLVLDRNSNHVHFIDGGDGGYAMAAKLLKEKRRSQV